MSTNTDLKSLIDRLEQTRSLSREEWIRLIRGRTPELAEYLFQRARIIRTRHYGRDIYIRGLIEFTSYCRNDCYYCGLRKSNKAAARYRLSREDILACCETGYRLGFRTFVLQGGEDGWYTDDLLEDIITSIHRRWPDCAITLSVGEKSYASYRRFARAGADRYLLRHETFDETHYRKLHPPRMSAAHRRQCLVDLKKLGYQTGTGFMVGSPYQTRENLADDMLFLKEFNPQMVGIGPFIPHHETPFAGKPAGTLELTLFMLGLIRLTLPHVLLPATTALATVDGKGHENGMNAGANVIMPNLTPKRERAKYTLYNNKANTGAESAEGLALLKEQMRRAGYEIVVGRGDFIP